MKLKIVPLGGARLSTAQAAAKIVDYLTPKEPPSNSFRPAVGNGTPARYYADGGEEPGRWLGHGAAELGLTGTVLPEDLRNVLAGRDPATGERLITAQGSAGRRPRLGVGSATRWGDGQFLYDERDAAAALGLERRESTQLLDAGTRLAASRLFGWLCGATEAEVGKPASQTGKDTAAPDRYLIPVIDSEGQRWVTDGELTRYEDAQTNDVSPADVLATGHPDELLPMAEAASLVGLTPRYLRELAKRYEDEGDIIDELVADGKKPQEAWLVAQRNKRGHWLVTRRELAAYVERRDPPKVRVGFDATMTTEKSLSILALLAQPRYGKQVLDAIEGANDMAMGWIEAHGAEYRIKGKVHRADGWTAATFRHLTSRALDPFVHHHNVIANTVTDRNGDRRALDARGLYRGARAASALATAEVRWRLTTQLGVRWRPTKHGGWEIEGLTDEMLSAFSQRRNEIEDALRELKEVIGRGTRPEDVEDVVLRTRPAKQAADVDELRAEWLSRAWAVGLTEHAIAELFHQQAPVTPPNPERVYSALVAPAGGVCEHLSVFGYGDLLKALVNMPDPDDDSDNPQPLLLSADKLEQLAQGFLRSNHVVPLVEKDELTRCVWTTAEILSAQDRIMSRYRKGLRDPHAATVANKTLARMLIRDAHLTAEQRNLVESFCTSGQRVQCGIGRAGAGKTTAMRTVTEAWAADGWKAVGAAVKGEAARILAAETGIRTETLAWWLAHPDPATVPLDQHTVLIVDEASTIGDRDLDRLLWLTEQTGTTVRLIGDPAQHSSVPAGGMFRVLCNQFNDQTPELHTSLRLQDPRDRAAANALREGKIDEAFDLLNLAGHLHVIDDELDFYKDILARWWNAWTTGDQHPMVDRRNTVRRQLNQLAHQFLQAHGEVAEEEIVAHGDRRFSTGDRVIARTPNRGLHANGDRSAYVRNGAVGTITHLQHGRTPEDDTITVAFDGIGQIHLPRHYFDQHEIAPGTLDVGLDHAYALTSYAVQGATTTVSTSRIDDHSSRSETYVDITRGREANHLYITRTNDPLDDETLPRLPPPRAERAVASRLARSKGELTAWEIRQQACPPDMSRHGRAAAVAI